MHKMGQQPGQPLASKMFTCPCMEKVSQGTATEALINSWECNSFPQVFSIHRVPAINPPRTLTDLWKNWHQGLNHRFK